MLRSHVRAAAMAALLLAGLVPATSAAAATATALMLPQSTAFSILGASCGGIQEQVSATGFDATTGYPTGIVQLSTSCGGSGRGGGYHTTKYTASVGVTWDLTAAVVSYVSPAPAVAVNPTLSVYDAHGNRLYNQSNAAYLLLAAGFVPAARIASVAPKTGPSSGGTAVTITGTGFTGATRVSFGALAAASFTVASSTVITAVAPAAASGSVDVRITNAGGVSAAGATDQFTFVAAPVVTGVSPNAGSPAGGTAVTISGSHLTGATRVAFGGTSAGFTVNSDSSITAYAPGAASAGAVDVRVTTVGGTSARSAADRFTYVVTRPVVGAISPSLGPIDGGTPVAITGSNLSGVTEVDFGGTPASFLINDDTSITAYSPTAAVGTVDVTAVSYGARSATSASDRFTYALVVPVVDAVSPATGVVDGGTAVMITGSNLLNVGEVDFGGVPAYFWVNDDTSITAFSPAGSAGTVDVTAISYDGTSATTPGDQFTYVAAPAVTAIDPATGPVEGGTAVTITGTDLGSASEVDFGGVAASFVVNADGVITAVTPAGIAGPVDVTVTTDGGMSATTASDVFTYE